MAPDQAKVSVRCLLVHYDEIALKGKNRPWFEKRLVQNLREAAGDPAPRIRPLPGRILVHAPESDLPALARRLRLIPGVSSVAAASHLPLDWETLEREAVEMASAASFASFAVRAVRQDKNLPFKSKDVEIRLGGRIQAATGKRVDLETPDWTLHAELLSREALLYHDRLRGSGGLPVGTAGTVLCLLSGGIDSPAAAYLAMKRGCRVHFLHFHSFPFSTDRGSQDKCRRIVRHFRGIQGNGRLWMAAIGEEQRRISLEAPAKLRTLLYRRLMVLTGQRLALRHRWEALVTGDSLGQVASQTLPNLAVVERGLALPLLRPLVCANKLEIVNLAREIGTYDVSIEAQDDCCRFLEPDRVETSADGPSFARVEEDLRLADAAARIAGECVEDADPLPITSAPPP